MTYFCCKSVYCITGDSVFGRCANDRYNEEVGTSSFSLFDRFCNDACNGIRVIFPVWVYWAKLSSLLSGVRYCCWNRNPDRVTILEKAVDCHCTRRDKKSY